MARAAGKIRIGLAQVNPTVGDLAGNSALIARVVAEAKARGVQLLAFPELVLCGYPPEDLLLGPDFVSDCRRRLRELARLSRGIAVIVGAPGSAPGAVTRRSARAAGRPGSARGEALHNCAFLLHRGKVAVASRKIHLPNYGVFDEKRYFVPGPAASVLDFAGRRIAVNICEDIWVDDGPILRQTTEGGAAVVVNISASPYHRRKGPLRERLMQRRARESGAWLFSVNLVGGQDELVFDGSSVICSPDGETVARGMSFHEDFLVADIPLGGAPRPARRRFAPAGAGGSALEIVALPALPSVRRARLRQRPPAPHPAPSAEVYGALVLGTRDYVEKNGFSGVVLGLSGGLDSALAAAIAVDALGSGRVNTVTMPSPFTAPETLRDARALAGNLGIRLHELPIDDVFESYRALLAPHLPSGEISVAEENIQARIRGNILMALSNRYGWLVLTTGNKSEVAVGYCTLYGDMAGGFAVLKDVPKTTVFSLCRYRNRLAGRALIPATTIRRPPSAELRPGQTDQDTLPPYAVLDRIIELYVERDRSLREIVASGIDAATARRVVRMIDSNEYKRRQGPPGIKITPKAFGRDRRLPITSRYRPGGR